MTVAVNDRVIVRIDFRDEAGTVTRLLPRNQAVVVTDSGDCRAWCRNALRSPDPDSTRQH